MYIQTEATPNPNTLKFLPGQQVLAEGVMNFSSAADVAGKSPLAEVIFQIPGVTQVFLSHDFISVSKEEDGDWDRIRGQIITTVLEHFIAGRPVITDGQENSQKNHGEHEDIEEDEIVKEIKELIEIKVRPAVAQDGGDITFKSFKNGIVYLEMHGACSGCPSSTITLKNGIENMLKHYIPEVIAVESADELYHDENFDL